MKRFAVVFLIVVFGMMVLSACAPAQGVAAQLVALPDEGRLLVLSLLTTGVMWLLLKASEFFKVDLSGYANAIAVALAPIIITLIERALQMIPPVFDNVVLTIIHLIVLLIGSIGTFFLLKRRTPTLR